MALDRTKTYLVLNYTTSAVSINTRNGSELVPAGNDFNPTVLPLTIDDIIYLNANSPVFKIGLLFFESEYEEEIYNELRIHDWKDILRNREIEDIILYPDVDSLERLLRIKSPMYFNRIYGVFLGLKNAGADISNKVVQIMEMRQKEIKKKKWNTEIEIRPKDVEKETSPEVVSMQQKMEAQAKELEELKAMIAKLSMGGNVAEETAQEKPKTTRARSGTKKAAEA